jgi:hypothetical protein
MSTPEEIMAIDDPFDAVAKQYPKDESNIPKAVSGVTGAMLTVAALAGVPNLAVASAIVSAWNRLTNRDDFRNRTEETQALLVERVRTLEAQYERLESEQRPLTVDVEDLKSSIQLAIVNDAQTFDDRKRERFIRAISNATISPAKVSDLVSFVQDIDQMNETDVTVLKVLNSVMNRQGDWDRVTPTQGLHPNTFIHRRHELAVQIAIALGKTNKTDGDGFSREEGLGICLRLQGFGLAEVINSETRSVPRTNYCARPTPRGLMLLRLIDETVSNWERYFDEDGPI